MQVKGVSMAATIGFIRSKFGEPGLKKWLGALSEKSREIFANRINEKEWYPIQEGTVEPVAAACKMFYGGDFKGAWEMGRFSADYSLKGIFKMFIKVASPLFVLDRAGQIFSSYYYPCAVSFTRHTDKAVTIQVTQFDDITEYIEQRTAGWLERTLEICRVKDIKVIVKRSLAKKQGMAEFYLEWK